MRADLILYPESGGFAPAARALASSLAAQASVALENARRHRLVERQAATDELTGLPNRRLFMRSLAAEIARAKRTGETFSVVMLDLDDFKRVNDRFGHDAGDRALRAFADVLRSAMRETDVAARIGGEEFACLLPSSDVAGAYGLAERIRTELAGRAIALPDGREVSITASLGIAAYPDGEDCGGLFCGRRISRSTGRRPKGRTASLRTAVRDEYSVSPGPRSALFVATAATSAYLWGQVLQPQIAQIAAPQPRSLPATPQRRGSCRQPEGRQAVAAAGGRPERARTLGAAGLGGAHLRSRSPWPRPLVARLRL